MRNVRLAVGRRIRLVALRQPNLSDPARCSRRRAGKYSGSGPMSLGLTCCRVLAGPLRQLPNLRQIVEAYAELQEANLLGAVRDEYADSAQIDALLDDLAARGVAWAPSGYRPLSCRWAGTSCSAIGPGATEGQIAPFRRMLDST